MSPPKTCEIEFRKSKNVKTHGAILEKIQNAKTHVEAGFANQKMPKTHGEVEFVKSNMPKTW